MDLLHVHLLLNHVPVIGSVGCAMLLITALVVRSRDLTIAGLAALVAIALIALPVFFTGEPAEERVENLPGVSEALIGQHENAATQALVAMEVAGLAALMTLFLIRLRGDVAHASVMISLVLALIAIVLIARAASLGGAIRHTEIQSTSVAGAAGAETAEDD